MNIAKNTLTQHQGNLLRQMQFINFGEILNIQVRHGEPILTSTTKIKRLVRFGGNNESRPELTLNDFALKEKVVELFDTIGRMSDGFIEKIEVKHGLPFDMIVEEQAI